ncbi:hypothetical protein QR680_016935 [Steinernema hermaphroditum]|uniref:Uncharacterized protein n=1 Tax=Steinernema hermaphroditum TaxID=289476 RepID=A0AA39HCR7_9BILA|nr:hypothetical protein QR680_016935 [Steinernema hermaphroditum]
MAFPLGSRLFLTETFFSLSTATTSLAKSAPASLMEQQKISIFLASMNALEEKFTFGVASGEVEFNFPNVFVDVLGENAPE